MTFIFRNKTIFWDISKWNRGQKKWDGGSTKHAKNGKFQILPPFLVSFLSGHLVFSHVHIYTFCDSLFHTDTCFTKSYILTYTSILWLLFLPLFFFTHTLLHLLGLTTPTQWTLDTHKYTIINTSPLVEGCSLVHAPTRHHCLGVWLIWDDLSLQISVLPVTRDLKCP